VTDVLTSSVGWIAAGNCSLFGSMSTLLDRLMYGWQDAEICWDNECMFDYLLIGECVCLCLCLCLFLSVCVCVCVCV
jgi:hypothetical protein